VGKETSQRLGMEGVQEIKEWLEATTRFAFTYTVYDSEPMCTLTCLDESKKAFDLEGNTTKEPKRPVSVEAKKYSTVGHQAAEFKKFVAIAYSSTAQVIEDIGEDWFREFLWVTYHPFSQTDWPHLLTLSYLRGCLEEHEELLAGKEVDDDLLAKVASRLWVLVVQQKQVDIRLTKLELMVVNAAFAKEGW
jgi:hypothetical protein